jgi:hypothetical protein
VASQIASYQDVNIGWHGDFAFDAYPVGVASDPFPIYRTMRDKDPVVWCEPTQAWALSLYDDVLTAVRDTDPFSSAYGNIVNDNPARARRKLGTTDPPPTSSCPSSWTLCSRNELSISMNRQSGCSASRCLRMPSLMEALSLCTVRSRSRRSRP